jgi:ClpP class serine protease
MGRFEVVVPKMAKSAGTLICLGATKIIMGEMAELGPLDMQVVDRESGVWDSALNETKSLQTLSREALVLYTEKMELLKKVQRWKTFETRNRIATDFVNEMIRPLVEKIDAVHYTKMVRIMKS